MYVERVVAYNFQGYDAFDIGFTLGPWGITGPNMSGKSTTPRAIVWCAVGRFPYPNLKWTNEMILPGNTPERLARLAAEKALLADESPAAPVEGDEIGGAENPDEADQPSPKKKNKRKGTDLPTAVRIWVAVPAGVDGDEERLDRYQFLRVFHNDKWTFHAWSETGTYVAGGAAAQDFFLNLARIPAVGTQMDRINIFIRCSWYGVGQQTSFFEAHGVERKKILERLDPTTRLAAMEKEAAVRVKTRDKAADDFEKEATEAAGRAKAIKGELLRSLPLDIRKNLTSGVRDEMEHPAELLAAGLSGLLGTGEAEKELAAKVDAGRRSLAAIKARRSDVERDLVLAAELRQLESRLSEGLPPDSMDPAAELAEIQAVQRNVAELRSRSSIVVERLGSIDQALAALESDGIRVAAEKVRFERAMADAADTAALAGAILEISGDSLTSVASGLATESANFELIAARTTSVRDNLHNFVNRYRSGKQTPDALADFASIMDQAIPQDARSKADDFDAQAEKVRNDYSAESGRLARLDSMLSERSAYLKTIAIAEESKNRVEADASVIAAEYDGVAQFAAVAVTLLVTLDQLEPVTIPNGQTKFGRPKDLIDQTSELRLSVSGLLGGLAAADAALSTSWRDEPGLQADSKVINFLEARIQNFEAAAVALEASDQKFKAMELSVSDAGERLAVARSQQRAAVDDLARLSETMANVQAGIGTVMPVCAHCKSPLTADHLDSHIDEARGLSAKLLSKIEGLTKDLATLKRDLADVESERRNHAKIVDEFSSAVSRSVAAARQVIRAIGVSGSSSEEILAAVAVKTEGMLVRDLTPMSQRLASIEAESAVAARALEELEGESLSPLALAEGVKIEELKGIRDEMAVRLARKEADAKGEIARLNALGQELRGVASSFEAFLSGLVRDAQACVTGLSPRALRDLDATLSGEFAEAERKIASDKVVQNDLMSKAKLESALVLESISEIVNSDEHLSIEKAAAFLLAFQDEVAAEVKKLEACISSLSGSRNRANVIVGVRAEIAARCPASLAEYDGEALVKLDSDAEMLLQDLSIRQELGRSRANLLRLAEEATEAEKRHASYHEMALCEREETESLHVIKGILAPNGDARTLALSDTVAMIVAATNANLRSLELDVALAVDLKLEKDEESQPIIEIVFSVDGDSSGRMLPSESQRKIVGLCMDLSVARLLTRDGFIIIDEPETGLDDAVKRKFMNFLKRAAPQVIFVTNTAAAGLEQFHTTMNIRRSGSGVTGATIGVDSLKEKRTGKQAREATKGKGRRAGRPGVVESEDVTADTGEV